jgi:transposase
MQGVEITAGQYERIQDCLPVQRGNVRHQNLVLLNAILYVAEHGCKWRGLPKRYGNWHSVYVRMNRWAKKGVLDQLFAKLQQEQILRIKIEAFRFGLDLGESAPRRNWGSKKTDHRPSENRAGDGTPRFIWLPRMLERQ